MSLVGGGGEVGGLYLIRTGDDFGELALVFVLALDDGFDDAGMVGPQVDEDMADACLPQGLEECE